MKKKLVLVIAICLVLALTFTLFACGDKDKGNGSGTNTQTQTGDNHGTGNGGGNGSGTNQGGTTQPDTGNGGNGGGTTPSGNEGVQGGTQDATVRTKTMATRESIMTAIGDTYKVVAQSPDGQAVTTVASDGTYFYANDPYESFNKKLYDNTYLYPYTSIWDGKYHKMSTPTFTADGSAPTMLGRGNVGYMFQFAGETLSYNTEEAVTVAGRAAKKYTFESTNAYGYNLYFHEEVTIDDATGACLKYAYEGRMGAGSTGATRNKVNFEVTELSYGTGNAAARAFLDGYIAKIDVSAWDSDYIAAVGLSAVAAPQGELFYSEWVDDDHNSRDSEYPYWDVQYKLYSDTQSEYQDYVRAFCRAFYDAGAKIDAGTHEADFDDVFSANGEDMDDFNLCAYVVGNPDYQVYVSVYYNKYASQKYWNIEVEIKRED